jgi:hypothetical protein
MMIIRTDNFGGDYPIEAFVQNLPLLSEINAKKIADAINSVLTSDHPHFYRVVDDNYVLCAGFEA